MMEQVVDPGEASALYERAYSDVMPQLEQNLPAHLKFHNAAHTKAVIAVTEKLAAAEGISGEELLLLKTAALFHDTGYLHTYEGHEEASCLIARQTLGASGFTTNQIETICQIIMATRLPQTPVNKLQQIICDADLHHLGTDDYFAKAAHLFQEFKTMGLVKDRKEWDQKQVQFLTSHRFFTQHAKSEYAAGRASHLKTVLNAGTITGRYHALVPALQDIILIFSGVFITGFALMGFLVPNDFLDGGVTGMSLLLHHWFHFDLAITIVVLNLPFILAAYFWDSKTFAFKTFISVILLGLCLEYVPYPFISTDHLIYSVFGGVFLGLGIGLAMRAGCALDGIEILALYTLKRTSFTITEIILGLNSIIFTIAAFVLGLEKALYSVLTYYIASRMIDFVIEGIQAYISVTIISGKSDLIKHKLVNELRKAITIYKGERGFLPGKFEVSNDCDIIFTVVTRLELRKLKKLVYATDANAFVYVNTIREASGGILTRRGGH